MSTEVDPNQISDNRDRPEPGGSQLDQVNKESQIVQALKYEKCQTSQKYV